ncbi:CHAP domain-containing protein [Streptomyces sp. AP-93]|uniref:CHAP domain-containing protein n=1 Tax=Streptomyces sp. AP-93 TaxID=2929048 RepID=UPI001FAF00B9|nr:CHAP domain-containing protein [Streptomyces sp. AP-93]MCJ0871897.1 CHAP domain-containing protein [Streptomyces sp. AP-93]
MPVSPSPSPSPSRSRSRRRPLAALALVLTAPLLGLTGAASAAADGGQVATTANAQIGKGCSSFYGCPHPGAWCADFARWVWGQGGAQTSGLGGAAYSFVTYGRQRGTIHSTPQVGDAVVYATAANWSSGWANHVNVVVAVSGDTITTIGGNESNSVKKTTFNWRTNGNPVNAGAIRAFVGAVWTAPPANTNPASLPAGTLIKGPGSATVKVVVSGAGLSITGDDVTRDGYDLSTIVPVTDAAFNALPSVLPNGSVLIDQSGTDRTVYASTSGVSLPLNGAEFTAYGYDTRPLMGVPTSYIANTTGRPLPDQSLVKAPGDATVKLLVGAAGFALTMDDVNAMGLDLGRTVEVPPSYFTSLPTTLANKTLFKEPGNATVKVAAGGAGAALTLNDVNALGYDLSQTRTIPSHAYSAIGTTPAEGTLLLAPGDATVWLMTGGRKHGLTGAEWNAGGYRDADIVRVPAAFLAALPTT